MKTNTQNIGVQYKKRLEFLKVVDVIQDFYFIFYTQKVAYFVLKDSSQSK